MKNRKVLFLIIALLFIPALFFSGFFLGKKSVKLQNLNNNDISKVIALRSGGYKFINPLLDFEQSEKDYTELVPFKNEINQYINSAEAAGKAELVSVYFRDLNNGPWYGINETASFTPASLMKVPLMMAYYKQAETDPGILTQEILVPTSTLPSYPQVIKPEDTLKPGQTYTAEQLIEYMIKYSENTAAFLLIEHIPLKTLEQVYTQFDIPIPTDQNPQLVLNSKTVGSFLRVLYNGSFLTKQYSEQALELMAQAEFKNGLVAGVPGSVAVAHKFGENETTDSSEEELHDCGIIYYPKHPYTLCVMTRGKDLDQLSKVISNISAMVYNEVNNQVGSGN